MCDVQFKVVNNIQSYFPWYLISYILREQEVSLWRFVHITVVEKKTSILVAISFFVTRDLNVRIQLGKQLFWIQHIQMM